MLKILFAGLPERCVQTNDAQSANGTLTAQCSPSAELVTAAALSALGCETSLFTKLGERHRDTLKKRLTDAGIDLTYVYETNDTAITEKDVHKLKLDEYSAVFFTGAFPAASEQTRNAALTLVKLAKENNTAFVFDPDFSGVDMPAGKERRKLINEFSYLADVFTPSIEEARELSGLCEVMEIGKSFLEHGTKKVVIKLGKGGAFFLSEKEYGTTPTFRAEPVDETGAGNAFAAGLLYGICEELPLGEAALRANALASMQIQYKGDNEHMPTMQELREYMLERRFVVDCCKDV